MKNPSWAVAAAVLVPACAKEMPPPGTLPDKVPPRITEIRPAPDSVVAGFDGSVRIRFDEPVNIPNDLERRLFASPMERYQVEKGFSDLRLRPRGGWRDSTIYCLEIPEGITDLLRNRTEEPTSFCFSTGLPIPETRVTGTVRDVITGLPSDEARILFIAPGDSTPYGALTDSDGRFSARALPPGEYQAFGFLDQNRNLALQKESEPHDSVSFVLDTERIRDLEFVVVPPDTTPPLLMRVEATDSITIQLEFDDYLLNPPEEDPVVVVRDSATRAEFAVVAVRIGQPLEIQFPSPDTIPPDSLQAFQDSLGARRDSVGDAADSLTAAIPATPDPFLPPPELLEPSEPTEPRPSRFVSVRLEQALDSVTYVVQASGIVNLRHLTGGGDTTFVAVILPSPSDSVGPVTFDSLAASPDTVGVPPDTLGVPPDTVTASPATVGRPPDVGRVARRERGIHW